MKKKKKIAAGLFVCLLLTIVAGCGSAKIDETHSPVLSSVSVEPYNNGNEDSQFVKLTLFFDRPVSTKKDSLENMRITIADERMEAEVSQPDDTSLCFEIPVTAITRGNLSITEEKEGKGYPNITDADGKYAIRTFFLETLIPSGVTLEDTGNDRTNGFEKEVKGTWVIRNITWLRLLDNGTVVQSQNDMKSELMDGAIAVHGHDFLLYDSDMIAEEMAETLNKHFDNRYVFRSEGSRIIGETLDGSDADLDLEIYQYQKIEVE